MSKTSVDLADPALISFLQKRIKSDPRLKPESLAEASQGRYCAANIDKSLRQPTIMFAQKAEAILELAGLRSEWEAVQATPRFLSQLDGVFSYSSRRFGFIEELRLESLIERGIDTWFIAESLVEIDTSLFAHVAPPAWVGKVEDWHDVMMFDPEPWRVFLGPNGAVLGYWMYVNPITSVFSQGCLGNYPESAITVDTLKPVKGSRVNIYGPGMYCRPYIKGWERAMLGSHLVTSFLFHIRRLEQMGEQFDEICIPVCAEEGRRLAEDKFGLERMPTSISKRYADHMGWPSTDNGKGLIPSLYYGRLSGQLRARTGLTQKSDINPESPIAKLAIPA